MVGDANEWSLDIFGFVLRPLSFVISVEQEPMTNDE